MWGLWWIWGFRLTNFGAGGDSLDSRLWGGVGQESNRSMPSYACLTAGGSNRQIFVDSTAFHLAVDLASCGQERAQ